jgi:hypothetical protein
VRAGKPAAAIAIAAAGLVAVGVGITGLVLTRHATAAVRPAALVSALPAPTGPIAAPPPSDIRPVAAPVSLTIPVIGVSTRLIRLGLLPAGALQVPDSTSVAGWYTGSSRPGAVGPAVIVGHIDSRVGPGVFYRLAGLRRGDRVYVRRADGTLAAFRVTSVSTYPKDAFPTQAVYGPTPDAELRLITCGGAFDPGSGSYLSNIVVYAVAIT